MKRTLGLRVNKLPVVPASLRSDPPTNLASPTVSVDLGRLYHHYYFDSYGERPPDPDPSNFEYLQFLSATAEFRFINNGPGASSIKRRNISAELGQAFCRWMLHDHFGIRYFAHFSRLLERTTHPAFEGMRILRKDDGDTPDYLCARSVTKPMLAEAKGRFKPVAFAAAEFQTWRDQFARVQVVERSGRATKLKGFIVATRFVTEANPKLPTTVLYLEDPETDGFEQTVDSVISPLGRLIVAEHYATVIQKLGLSLLASSLEFGFTVPAEIGFVVPVWTCQLPQLASKRFIGGYWPRGESSVTFTSAGILPADKEDLLILGHRHYPFVGLDLSVAQGLRSASLGRWGALDELPEMEFDVERPSQVTWLADGTITGPLEFFQLENIIQL